MSTPTKATTATLSPALRMSFADACLAFEDLDAQWQLVPDGARAHLEEAWSRILAVARQQGIDDLRTLLTDMPRVLRALGASNAAITKTADDADLATFHLHRNVIVAIATAAAAAIGADVTGVYAHPVNLAMPARTADVRHHKRPAEVDEIVLLRTYTALKAASCDQRIRASAATIALADAGLMLRETNEVTVADFVEVEDNLATAVLAPGNGTGVATRFISLEPFHAHVLRPVLSTTSHGEAALYSPRGHKPGSCAPMSAAHGVVKRAIAAVGLRHPDLDPASLRRWRVRHTWETDGPDRAMDLSGVNLARTAELADISLAVADFEGEHEDDVDRF